MTGLVAQINAQQLFKNKGNFEKVHSCDIKFSIFGMTTEESITLKLTHTFALIEFYDVNCTLRLGFSPKIVFNMLVLPLNVFRILENPQRVLST